ncbi:MAG TPA: peptidoglycan-binding protein [Bryobacteraceae bacterium]|jgi:GH24 family phage-related lysozyme (muramidase)|nr:peptidoglycan-binding protein [Bryobacteraceae bacterium]
MRTVNKHWRGRARQVPHGFAWSGPVIDSDFLSSFDRPLKRGDSGYGVHVLQHRLRIAGEIMVRETGTFDAATEAAVRRFQRYYHVLETGEADPGTMRALVDKVAYLRADEESAIIRRFVPTWNGYHSGTMIAYRPAEISGMSQAGKDLLLFNETGGDYDTTAYLHWPGNQSSGVTLGIGYDMGRRDEQPIKADLTGIGIDVDTASRVAAVSARKRGNDAGDVVDAYGEDGDKGALIHLTYNDQIALMQYILPDYEHRVKRSVTELLLPCEFDALVSLAWDPGGCFDHIVGSINRGQVANALKRWSTCTGTDPYVQKGLQHRRRREIEFFLTGRFTKA